MTAGVPVQGSAGAAPDASSSWTAALRRRAVRTLPPERLLPDRQPAYVASWIYVFGVAHARGASVVDPASPAPGWRLGRPDLVAHQLARPLRQQPAPVERGAVLLLHGDPPVGQVLHGGVARPPRAHLDDRRGRLPRLDRDRLHRLPGADELRLPVDRVRGEGRHQLLRCRRLLERPRRRPDAAVARDAAAARGRRPRGPAPAAGTRARRRAPDRRRRRRQPRRTKGRWRDDRGPDPQPARQRASPASTWRGPTREYDLVKEFVAALAVVALLTAVLAALFSSPDEKTDHAAGLGHGGTRGLRRDGDRGAGRDDDERRLRRRRTTTTGDGQSIGPDRPPEVGRRADPGRPGAGLRRRPRCPT